MSERLLTIKGTTIEHRPCPVIRQNGRCRPLGHSAVILRLIAATTPITGVTVTSCLEMNGNLKETKVADGGRATRRIERDTVQGVWDNTILPCTIRNA